MNFAIQFARFINEHVPACTGLGIRKTQEELLRKMFMLVQGYTIIPEKDKYLQTYKYYEVLVIIKKEKSF